MSRDNYGVIYENQTGGWELWDFSASDERCDDEKKKDGKPYFVATTEQEMEDWISKSGYWAEYGISVVRQPDEIVRRIVVQVVGEILQTGLSQQPSQEPVFTLWKSGKVTWGNA